MAELYSLPDGWEWKKLEDLFTITSSKRVLKEDWLEKGIPFYRAREIVKLSQNGFVDNELFISEEMYNSFSKKYGLPKVNDILVTGVGTLGITYIVKENEKFYFKDGNIIWLKNDSNTNSKYIEYGFQTEFLKNQINSNSGSTVATYTITNANNTIIPIPPLEEQKRIVAKLDNLFAKIDKAIALHQKNIDEANVFMASVLNDVFVELEEKYSSKTVYELCTKITDGTHSTPKYIDSGIPFLSVKNISQGVISFDDTKFISIEEHNLLSKRCNVEKNDILYTKVGTTGIAKVVDTDIEFSIFVSIALLKPKKDLISSMYFQHILNSPNCYEQSQSRTRGVANRNLVLNDIKQIFFPLPPLKTQQKVVSYLDEISNKMEKIKQIQKEKMQSLKELKASILDKAFKGEL
ncbi:restriction endonuclease subunit S [Aliarcobacter skirrowii]|uniref:Restriction endonuclease subunit S n=1 Tax=Aliarcobacter skirrowii TaxID=28200 RepID=A0AAW9DCL4_9BACT|nr:restriction endonuclease subunit S [Aliarcobacter skirrowii]MDX4069959.1 restriction endonuclease subunit S [Aliarcobacter skirrowii]